MSLVGDDLADFRWQLESLTPSTSARYSSGAVQGGDTMNGEQAGLREQEKQGAPNSGHASAGVMRERRQGARGLESRRARADRNRQKSRELCKELLLRCPDMPARRLCWVLSEYGCHLSLIAVRRARQQLAMSMAVESSKQRSASVRFEDSDDDYLPVDVGDCGTTCEQVER